ncbi:hypothetical protein L1987_39786 [Smallanthus sonchifolius]|uniref:Uncharacterized protein n=1 Tax=Smallanthus sonchifolius TaxID=185202 RepID=A0ACB9HPB1_9ASTR|nr:hypothetical protein L1987_39786 [Smallanthus sonchifolius]
MVCSEIFKHQPHVLFRLDKQKRLIFLLYNWMVSISHLNLIYRNNLNKDASSNIGTKCYIFFKAYAVTFWASYVGIHM